MEIIMYKCDQCDNLYESEEDLNIHIQTHYQPQYVTTKELDERSHTEKFDIR